MIWGSSPPTAGYFWDPTLPSLGIFLLDRQLADVLHQRISASVEVDFLGWPLRFTGMDLYLSAHCIAVKTVWLVLAASV